MKKEEIFFGDWARMFIGEVPGMFYIEVAIRTVFIYCLLVISMRIMGKRMSAQVSRNELAALVTLAAAIGVPLQEPGRGLLPALIIALVVILAGTAIARVSYRHPVFEGKTQGKIATLIENSRILTDTLQKVRVSRNRVFAELRSNGIRHLGEVKRLYMEAGGDFTLLRNEKPGPGLTVIPGWDADFIEEQEKAENVDVCSNCGAAYTIDHTPPCRYCGNAIRAAAIK